MKLLDYKDAVVGSVLVFQLAMVSACSPTKGSSTYSDRRISELPLSDPWEARPPGNFDYKSCLSLSRDVIVPVIEEKRGIAIALLERTASVPLDDGQLSEFVGVANASVPKLIEARIASLESERNIVLTQRKGSWSGVDEMRLVELERLRADLARLKAYLVRAVAKNESTGMFNAGLCADALFVSHLSLGETVPNSIRVPILVFLDRAPMDVYLATGMAR